MQCPRCQYEFEPFESECPRCKHLGAAAAPVDTNPVPEARRTPDTWFALKRMAGGILALLAACWIGNYFLGKPMVELALIRRGKVTQGFVYGQDNRLGSCGSYYYLYYTYHLPNGTVMSQTSPPISGTWHENSDKDRQLTVEYLPDHPEVSRIKGDGCESVIGWIFTRAFVTVFFGSFFVWLGISMVRDGYRRLREGDPAEETYE